MKKTVYIGGRMGNQLLRYCIAIADSMKNGYEIEAVIVTHHPNRLIEMLDLKVPAISQSGRRLNDINYNTDENVRILFRYRNQLFGESWIRLKKVENFINAETCIHLRGTDLKAAPLRWYCNKAKEAFDKVHVCTDDRKYGDSFKIRLAEMRLEKDVVFTNQSDIRDWHTILKAGKVYCEPSSFALSTLLFDPDKKMIVCSRKSSTPEFRMKGRREIGFQFVETAMDYCPNLQFED